MPNNEQKAAELRRAALDYHEFPTPGKIAIAATKQLVNQHDLSLAYSPGVAAACEEIVADPANAFRYTARGNLVAVITNGTAVLGLGDIGPLAAKPVMEGKGVLFKKFAGIDVFDIEVNQKDLDKLIDLIAALEPTFGGINLEDIKAPDCFYVERALRSRMKIPVFHDDQHGTAIVAAAGLINACHLTGRDLRETRLVVNGAGAAAIACVELLKAMGLHPNNVILCDTKGVVFQGRTAGMNQWKSAHAIPTEARTLHEALLGADAFFGLSIKGALTPDMVAGMADAPIIFAMANPDPEITPEEARRARPNAIIATGRSDYPNQVNNVLGFPYIFRGALDVRARTINEAMKIAAAEALAQLAREDVPDEVSTAGAGLKLQFGRDYIIPNAFDPRLISRLAPAVARAAMESGVARRPIADLRKYARELSGRLDPTANALDAIMERVRAAPTRVAFAEGEEEKIVRAAVAFQRAGYGTPILIGREDRVRATMDRLGLTGGIAGIEIHNAKLSHRTVAYTDHLYGRLQRQGYLHRDCQRMVNLNRNVFAACMVATGDAAAMVTGLNRSPAVSIEDIGMAIDTAPGAVSFGLTLMVGKRGTIFIADTLVHGRPNAEQLSRIAIGAAAAARRLGHEPRVALLSFSSFGNPMDPTSEELRAAVRLLDAARERGEVDFEFDGEMSPDIALDMSLRSLYPFCRLTGPANILVMPGLHSAHITSRLAPRLGDAGVIGPLLIGLTHPAQLLPMDSSVSQIVDMAALAAHQTLERA